LKPKGLRAKVCIVCRLEQGFSTAWSQPGNPELATSLDRFLVGLDKRVGRFELDSFENKFLKKLILTYANN
jgi:hypothetical protein